MSAGASTTQAVESGSGGVLRLRHVIGKLPVLQVAAVLALFVIGSLTIDGYTGLSSIKSMLVLASFLGIAAAGQTFAILLGGIDLSVPAMIGAGNVILSELSGTHHWPFGLVLALLAALALVVGTANGVIAHRFDIHPLIVTLGMGSVITGGVLVWTQARLTGGAPAWLSNFVSPAGHTGPVGISPAIVVWLVLTLVIVVVLTRTAVGRRLYATGANPRAARLALINTTAVWVGAYTASALCATLAGILLAGFTGTGLFNVGDPYLFTTIASVVVGGTSLLGARGDYVRTVLGVLILTQVTTLLIGFGFSDPMQQVVLGAVIVVVVATYAREPHVRNRI